MRTELTAWTDKKHVAERAKLGIVPQPLNAAQTSELVNLLKNPQKAEEKEYVKLLSERVPPGVDEAAYVKAAFLAAVAKGEASSPLIDKETAVKVSCCSHTAFPIRAANFLTSGIDD